MIKGINLAGMEGIYGGGVAGSNWDRTTGPVAGTDYPVFATQLIDYYRKKKIGVFRILFSWERVQSELWGPVPATGPGYAAYFANLKGTVDYATTQGIAVILEPWQANSAGGAGGAMWRGALVGSPEVDLFAFADFWSKLAAIFKGNTLVAFGLVNEPNNMSTMAWWTIAQKCVDAIRAVGSTATLYIPGNGYTAASGWTQDYYDTAPTPRSNAYGWLNANGVGHPLYDPLKKCVAEVHVYLDPDAGGNSTDIVSATIARERLAPAVGEAAAQGYSVYLGEIGMYAGNPLAKAAWSNLVRYMKSTPALIGYTWFAGGAPEWWDDVAADGGGHFSVTPTKAARVYSGDTVNMKLIAKNFA